MATLHVRNVPDELYEHLRDHAERQGRSIGAEAVVLLRQALGQRSDLRRAVSRRRSPFLQRFAESAKELVVRAQELAREADSSHVTPAHVLLAMLEDDVLRTTLERSGIAEADVRAKLPHDGAPKGRIPFSAETKKLLEDALRTSLSRKDDVISPEHLLSAFGHHVETPYQPEEAYRAVTLEGDWTAQLNELAAEGWELFSVTPVDGEVRAILRR
jgi:plasmid stability protein